MGVRSAIPRKVKEIPLGEALGLALRLKLETEQPFADVAELLHQIAQHSPLTLINLPFPLKSVKDHSMRLMYNPKQSNTKNIAFVFGAGYGRKQSSSAVEVISPSPVEDIKKDIKMVLSKIPEASQAVAVNIQAILRSDSQDIKMMMVSVKGRQAYIAEIDATRIVRRPINTWDKEAILAEDLRSTINIKAKAGIEGQQLHDAMIDLVVERSEEMKAHAKNSEAWRKCEADSAKELRLRESCIKARRLAASLDVVKAELSLPRHVTRHPYMITLATAVKAYFLPYLSIEDS